MPTGSTHGARYHGDGEASLLLLNHLLLRQETIGLQLFGGPRPFLVLEPANLPNLWPHLDCIRQAGE